LNRITDRFTKKATLNSTADTCVVLKIVAGETFVAYYLLDILGWRALLAVVQFTLEALVIA